MRFLADVRKRCAGRLASTINFRFLKPLLRSRLTSVFYHTVNDEPNVLVKHLYRHRNVATFQQDLEFFAKHFTFVTFEEVLRHFEDGVALPRYPLYLSFDDGHCEMAEIVAPILLRMGLPASFFLTTGIIDNTELIMAHKKSCLLERLSMLDTRNITELGERMGGSRYLDIERVQNDLYQVVQGMHPYKDSKGIDRLSRLMDVDWSEYLSAEPYLTSEQVNSLLRDGFHIGAHGVEHVKFMYLSLEERFQQVVESVSFLRTTFGLTRVGFSFPNSDALVDLKWMEQMCREHPEIGLFISTGKFAGCRWPLVHRIGMENPSNGCEEFPAGNPARKLVKAAVGTI